jgi:hypothetical protein
MEPPRARSTEDAYGIDPVRDEIVGSTKRKEKKKDEKPIRLQDLIPSKDVSGGRRTIFGSPPPATRKPKK